MTEEFTNKAAQLFPTMFNAADANGNTLGSATELWSTVAEKFVDETRKILAPIDKIHTDVTYDLQVRNPDALPVVQVEVVKSVGDALVDATNWNQSAIENEYVDVKLHRISRPFKLSVYDITRGERIESKIAAAMNAVAQGVLGQFFTAAASASEHTVTGMDPETAASISGIFGADAETDILILNPVQYSKLVPTNGLSLNPETEGVYGIGKIYKSLIPGAAYDGLALATDGIVGALATPEIVTNQPGTYTQYLGTFAGVPMILMGKFDYDTQCIKASVETMCGFALTTAKHVKKIKVSTGVEDDTVTPDEGGSDTPAEGEAQG